MHGRVRDAATTRKKLLAAAAVPAALLIGVLAWRAPRVVAPAGQERPEVASPAEQRALPRAGANTPVDAAGLANQRAPLASDASATTHIVGRAVAAEDRAPLAGATVRIAKGDRRQVADWTAPPPVATGIDGRYELAFVADPEVQLDFRIEAPGRVPILGGWWRLRAGVTMDQGDVALPAAVPLMARVVDEHDAPVEDYVVQIDPLVLDGDRYGLRPRLRLGHQRSDRNGKLPTLTLAAGEWTVDEHSDTGLEFLGPRQFTIEPFEREKSLTLRVARPPPAETIAGRVLDTRGLAVAGLALWLTAGQGRGRRTTTTQADGTFFFPRLLLSDPPYRIGVHERQTGFALDGGRPFVEAERGASDVEIVVRRLPEVRVELTVVAAESNRPIERFAWSVVRVRDGRFDTGGTAKLGPSEHHPRGVLALTALHPGDHILFLRADDDARADVLALPLTVDEPGPIARRVPVALRTSWRVRVRDEVGQPVAGSSVRLRQSIDGGSVRSWTLEVDRAFVDGLWGTRPVLITAQAQTDAQGFAELRTAPQPGTAGLEVRGPTHAAVVIEPLAPPAAGGAVEVTVQRAAIVEGTIEPVSLLEEYGPDEAARERARLFALDEDDAARYLPEIQLRHATAHRVVARGRVGLDATFRLEAVPTGSWSIWLALRGRQPDGDSDWVERAVASVEDLRGGEHRRISVDASALQRTELRGRALLNGLPPAEGTALVLGSAMVRVSAGGAFTLRLPAGTYLPILRVLGGDRRHTDIWSAQPIVFESAQRTADVVFAFTRAAARLRIVTADGKPLANRLVSLHALDHDQVAEDRMLAWGRTDADGRVAFDPAPPFDAAIWAWGAEPIGGEPPGLVAWTRAPGLRIGELPAAASNGEREIVAGRK